MARFWAKEGDLCLQKCDSEWRVDIDRGREEQKWGSLLRVVVVNPYKRETMAARGVARRDVRSGQSLDVVCQWSDRISQEVGAPSVRIKEELGMITRFSAWISTNRYGEAYRCSTTLGGDYKFTLSGVEFEISVRYLSSVSSKKVDIWACSCERERERLRSIWAGGKAKELLIISHLMHTVTDSGIFSL